MQTPITVGRSTPIAPLAGLAPLGALTAPTVRTPPPGRPLPPVQVDGRHLTVDGEPWRVRAVTYGSFLPRPGDGAAFPPAEQVRADLRSVAGAGLNTVRTYCLPPTDLLDAAEELGLRLLVGLHHPDWRTAPDCSARSARRVRSAGRRAVDEALDRLVGRRCVAAVVVGNELPGDLVRLHGVRRVEAGLADLVARVHDGAPGLLATYANYPTTEYLRVEGQDLACVNVFLHDPAALRRYLQHLTVALGELPLVVSELGVDGRRVGAAAQAEALAGQLTVVDEVGIAGAAVFSLTDEWGVGGHPVQGWQFGLQDGARTPRPAFVVAGRWARRPLRELRPRWPTLSVVVCAYQEQDRLGRCLASLMALDYPGLEVVVVDDGSTDATASVARRFAVTVLVVPHGGLSTARNAGAQRATGVLVAFLDADAACHPEWPYHLALSFESDPSVVASGGPNLAMPGAGRTARAVDLSPGNPVEVLSRADRAEHVPGCNSVFRRAALLAAGGYLPALTTAGDDVDLCWRLIDGGGAVGFSAAAQVHHERRGTVRGYLRQQRGYGRAERMVSGRHPHRFNRWGHATWLSSVYGGPLGLPRLLPRVVGHGPGGSAAYQPVTGHRGARTLQTAAVLVLPATGLLGGSLLLAVLWTPALAFALLALLALGGYAAAVAAGVLIPRGEPGRWRLRALVVALHLLQPSARALGSWRTRALAPLPPAVRSGDRARWLDALHVALAQQRCAVRRAGPHSRYDLRVSAGLLLVARLTTALRWGSAPVAVARLGPRPSGMSVALGLPPALHATGAPPGLTVALIAALVAGGTVELLRLRQRIRRAVAVTTADRPPDQRPGG